VCSPVVLSALFRVMPSLGADLLARACMDLTVLLVQNEGNRDVFTATVWYDGDVFIMGFVFRFWGGGPWFCSVLMKFLLIKWD